MGHTTRIPDEELKRGDPAIDPDDDTDETTVKSKVVTPKAKKPAVTSTAAVKDK